MASPSIYVVRNEVDSNCDYHCNALASQFRTAKEIDFVAGERIPLTTADGVVLTGSTAGVYESTQYEWITEQESFIRELVDREIPTLGVCFGHQVVNSALGGTVEHVGTTSALVHTSLTDDPIFDGVNPIVVSLHGDVVTTPGEEMEVIASADHARIFATRHQKAPIWTVQFHPEITANHRNHLIEDFDWETNEYSFTDVNAGRIFKNFKRIVDKTN